MTGMGATIEGAAELERSTDAAIRDLEDMDAAESEAGRLIALRASSRAPVLSGALSRSIHATTEGAEVIVSTPLNYAGIQEYGLPSHNIAAQPYMRPAYADSQAAVVEAYAKQVRSEVGSIEGT